MIRVAICDDEMAVVGRMEKVIGHFAKQANYECDICGFHSGESLVKAVSDGECFDILYLDIQMKDLNGIETAKKIREMDKNLLLIYVSGNDHYLMQLFRLEVFDFLKKPVEDDALEKNFKAAYDRVCDKQIYFNFQYGFEQKRILTNDIMWFESDARQIKIHMQNGDIEVFNDKLNEVEDKLKAGKIPFIRIHQSYLVNYYMIKGKTQNKVIMYDGTSLSISEERKNSVKLIYNELIGGEVSG